MHHAPPPCAGGVRRRGNEDDHSAAPADRPRRAVPGRQLHHQGARELARDAAGQLSANFRPPRAFALGEAPMAYRTADNSERIKAFAGVILVHAALGFAILSGLNVSIVERTVERLKAFDINEPPPPAPEPPPPQRTAEKAKEEEGAAGKKAIPTPVVA